MADHAGHTIVRAARIGGDLTSERMPAMDPTRSERLKALTTKYGATDARSVKDGVVSLALEFPNGDRLVGRGPTTEAALTHLEERCAALDEGGHLDG